MVWVAAMNPETGRTVFHVQPSTYKDGDKRKKNRGADKRNRMSYHRKAEFLQDFLDAHNADPDLSQTTFCIGLPIEQSTLSKWLNKKEEIFAKAAVAKKATLFSAGNSDGNNKGKFPLMEEQLYSAFLERRKEGKAASFAWFKYKAKEIMSKTQAYFGAKFGASTG